MITPERVIELLGLKPLSVEGGYFRQTYSAEEIVDRAALPARYRQAKPFGSAIYFLLHGGEFSALHRLLSDELYHFYLGDSVEMLLLYPDGSSEVVVLGSDLEQGQQVQLIVPHETWQGSRLKAGSRFALLGTTMAPGFDPADFELGDREALARSYTDQIELIYALTRES